MMWARSKRSKFRRRATSRHILLTLALLLATSGLVRLGGFGMAIADDVNNLLRGTSASHGEPAICTTETDIETVLKALQAREQTLVENETALDKRLKILSNAEDTLDEKLQALVTAEKALAATMAAANTAASDDLTRLTTLYENMKPKQAIPLFETMDPEFAAGFLSRMKPPIAAQILAGLDPQSAYAISVVFAGRNSDAPTN
ncbi:hypothetical protein SAMN05444851_0822 [Aliiroseovarius sediminilitoris]|uniref:Flagellar motility protein MotE, a chaperone for MotC folding n=1 Tax=Aliiroseovarius sediminilitoris TaxID=1173584 RepID=A0A1I0NH74_9RHOB|nr:hypothetical protein SAMN05444851_0822 [Aliiroseovarius sediminilitoris]